MTENRYEEMRQKLLQDTGRYQIKTEVTEYKTTPAEITRARDLTKMLGRQVHPDEDPSGTAKYRYEDKTTVYDDVSEDELVRLALLSINEKLDKPAPPPPAPARPAHYEDTKSWITILGIALMALSVLIGLIAALGAGEIVPGVIKFMIFIVLSISGAFYGAVLIGIDKLISRR